MKYFLILLMLATFLFSSCQRRNPNAPAQDTDAATETDPAMAGAGTDEDPPPEETEEATDSEPSTTSLRQRSSATNPPPPGDASPPISSDNLTDSAADTANDSSTPTAPTIDDTAPQGESTADSTGLYETSEDDAPESLPLSNADSDATPLEGGADGSPPPTDEGEKDPYPGSEICEDRDHKMIYIAYGKIWACGIRWYATRTCVGISPSDDSQVTVQLYNFYVKSINLNVAARDNDALSNLSFSEEEKIPEVITTATFSQSPDDPLTLRGKIDGQLDNTHPLVAEMISLKTYGPVSATVVINTQSDHCFPPNLDPDLTGLTDGNCRLVFKNENKENFDVSYRMHIDPDKKLIDPTTHTPIIHDLSESCGILGIASGKLLRRNP